VKVAVIRTKGKGIEQSEGLGKRVLLGGKIPFERSPSVGTEGNKKKVRLAKGRGGGGKAMIPCDREWSLGGVVLASSSPGYSGKGGDRKEERETGHTTKVERCPVKRKERVK